MLANIFKKKSLLPATEFSNFFVLAKAAEKKKILREIVKKANNDQKRLYHSA